MSVNGWFNILLFVALCSSLDFPSKDVYTCGDLKPVYVERLSSLPRDGKQRKTYFRQSAVCLQQCCHTYICKGVRFQWRLRYTKCYYHYDAPGLETKKVESKGIGIPRSSNDLTSTPIQPDKTITKTGKVTKKQMADDKVLLMNFDKLFHSQKRNDNKHEEVTDDSETDEDVINDSTDKHLYDSMGLLNPHKPVYKPQADTFATRTSKRNKHKRSHSSGYFHLPQKGKYTHAIGPRSKIYKPSSDLLEHYLNVKPRHTRSQSRAIKSIDPLMKDMFKPRKNEVNRLIIPEEPYESEILFTSPNLTKTTSRSDSSIKNDVANQHKMTNASTTTLPKSDSQIDALRLLTTLDDGGEKSDPDNRTHADKSPAMIESKLDATSHHKQETRHIYASRKTNSLHNSEANNNTSQLTDTPKYFNSSTPINETDFDEINIQNSLLNSEQIPVIVIEPANTTVKRVIGKPNYTSTQISIIKNAFRKKEHLLPANYSSFHENNIAEDEVLNNEDFLQLPSVEHTSDNLDREEGPDASGKRSKYISKEISTNGLTDGGTRQSLGKRVQENSLNTDLTPVIFIKGNDLSASFKSNVNKSQKISEKKVPPLSKDDVIKIILTPETENNTSSKQASLEEIKENSPDSNVSQELYVKEDLQHTPYETETESYFGGESGDFDDLSTRHSMEEWKHDAKEPSSFLSDTSDKATDTLKYVSYSDNNENEPSTRSDIIHSSPIGIRKTSKGHRDFGVERIARHQTHGNHKERIRHLKHNHSIYRKKKGNENQRFREFHPLRLKQVEKITKLHGNSSAQTGNGGTFAKPARDGRIAIKTSKNAKKTRDERDARHEGKYSVLMKLHGYSK